MMYRHRLFAAVSCVAVMGGAVPALAAEDAQSNSQTTQAPATDSGTGDIVVTGRAGGNAIRKLEAGYSITTVSAAQIADAHPKSAGDLLKTIPGVWVESSGGVATTNVMVRGIPSTGDAPFVTEEINGIPVFGVNSPSFMDQTALFRYDSTVAGMEAVNGGPASMFEDGQPGLTVNNILREGHDKTEGSINLSRTTYGASRIDGYLSGKLADDTYYMVGGFYHDGDSVRTAGFDTEKGGQFTVNLTRKFNNGKLDIFARYTDDHGEWFAPFATGVPGLNLGTYNPLNNYTRYLQIVTPGNPNGRETFDLGSGRGWKGVVGGGNLNLQLAPNLDFADHFGFTSGTLQTTGLIAGGAGAITVAQALAGGNGNAGQTDVATVHTGQILSPGAYVQQYGAWVVEKQLNYISNDASFTFNVANNKLTAGYYFTHFSSNDAWSLGNSYWMQVGGSNDLVNLNNGALSSYALAEFGTADENALYLADSFQITPRLRLDAGIRYEIETTNYSSSYDSNLAGYNLDQCNAGTLTACGNGGAHVTRRAAPWTVGLDYKVTSDFNAYVRASKGYHLPSFDDIRSQVEQVSTGGGYLPALDNKWSVLSFEAGLKYHRHGLDAALTGFYDKVDGEVYNDVGVPPEIAGSKTYGLEFAAGWTSDFGFSIVTDDVLESPKTWAPGMPFDNLQAARIPKYQLRITPAYQYTRGDNSAKIYATFEAIGKRYSDLQNDQPLPAYSTISAGVRFEHNAFSLDIAGDNLTNSHGLTEGNPRSVGVTDGVMPDSRPIFGRSFTFTVGYKF